MSDDDKKGGGESAVPFVRRGRTCATAALAQERLTLHEQSVAVAARSAERQRALRGFRLYSAREYWTEVAEPACHRFINDESRGNAIAAFLLLWPLHDWLWHEQHPGEDTRKSKGYDAFRQQLFASCPELAWLRDVADAGKHRGLGRANVQVREVAKTWPRNTQPLTMVLDNGTEHNITDVLLRIVEYFRKAHFPK